MKNKRERNNQQMSFSVSVSVDRIPGTGFLLDLSQRSQGKVLKISLRCICPSVRQSVIKVNITEHLSDPRDLFKMQNIFMSDLFPGFLFMSVCHASSSMVRLCGSFLWFKTSVPWSENKPWQNLGKRMNELTDWMRNKVRFIWIFLVDILADNRLCRLGTYWEIPTQAYTGLDSVGAEKDLYSRLTSARKLWQTN